MMQTTGPIDGNVALFIIKFPCAVQRCSRVARTEVKDAFKHWTVRRVKGNMKLEPYKVGSAAARKSRDVRINQWLECSAFFLSIPR